MFNSKKSVLKKWREVSNLPDLPIRTEDQLAVSKSFHDLILEQLNKDIAEHQIRPGTPERDELDALAAKIEEHYRDIEKRFRSSK